MSNQVVKFNPAGIRQEVVKQMEAMQTSKFVQLPENYKESVFFAMDKLAGLYQIEQVPASDISKTLINMFSNKLDFRKNHCYFFVQNDKNSQTGKSLRFGWQYQGKIHVAKEQCNVFDVIPVLVSEEDEFEKHYEHGAFIIDKHIPTFGEKIVGGYCVVEFNDGRRLIRYYTRAELDKRRSASKAPKGNFWAWEREMFEKTLINATLQRIIETSSDTTVDESFYEDREQEIDRREVVDAEIIEQGEPSEVAEQPVQDTQQEVFKLQ
jgi:recombinational DNA repair protein RecT